MTFSTVEQSSKCLGVMADITVNPSQGGDLIPSVSIDRIIAQRNSGIAQFMDGMTHWTGGTSLRNTVMRLPS